MGQQALLQCVACSLLLGESLDIAVYVDFKMYTQLESFHQKMN